MCTTLSRLREGLSGFAAGLVVEDLTAAQAGALLAEAARIERISAALTVSLSARVARDPGQPSLAHQLASATGLSVGEASNRVAAGRRLADQPQLAAAAAQGELSAPALAAICDAAAANPAATDRLVALAGQASLAEVTDECRRTKAAATADDGAARRERIYAQRSLRTYTDPGGVGHLHLQHLPEVIAGLIDGLAATREQLFQQARRAGRRERPDALDADALVQVVHQPAAGTPGRIGKLIVRVDFDTLLRGFPAHGEICEIPGYGPIPVAAVTAMIQSGNGFLAAIVTRGHDVATVAHLGRGPNQYQKTALQWTQPECTVLGCHNRRIEHDHRTPWAQTKITLLGELDALCPYHHRLKTNQHWALVEGTGKRPIVPPTDPRHPKHARHARAPDPRRARARSPAEVAR